MIMDIFLRNKLFSVFIKFCLIDNEVDGYVY